MTDLLEISLDSNVELETLSQKSLCSYLKQSPMGHSGGSWEDLSDESHVDGQ